MYICSTLCLQCTNIQYTEDESVKFNPFAIFKPLTQLFKSLATYYLTKRHIHIYRQYCPQIYNLFISAVNASFSALFRSKYKLILHSLIVHIFCLSCNSKTTDKLCKKKLPKNRSFLQNFLQSYLILIDKQVNFIKSILF